MSDKILALDHMMIHVPSSQKAGAMFERLGFVATPKSGMPGLSNRLICFGDTPHESGVCNYIELMALEDATAAPPPMPQLLDGYGPVSTVLSVDDASAVTVRLRGEGMEIGNVLDLQRDWALPGGEVITPAFSVAIPELGQGPVYWNYCAHKTPHFYVRSEFVNHPNGALCFDEAYIIAADVDEAAAHYRRHWQAEWDGSRLTLPIGPSLRLFSREEGAKELSGDLIDDTEPGVKALRVVVADLALARSVIATVGVETVTLPDGFGVRARDAEGCAMIFGERRA